MSIPAPTYGAWSRRLVHSSVLLASVTGVACAMYALFPDEQRMFDIANHDHRDALSIAYLQALLRTHPDNAAIRHSLARDLAATGDWAGARRTLAPLAGLPGSAGSEARLALFEFERMRLRQTPASDPARRVIAADIAQRITAALRQAEPSVPFERLLDAGREIGRPDLVGHVLERLADGGAATRAHWLGVTARHWLSNGAPQKAALAYHRLAMLPGESPASRRSNTMLALDAYVAADQTAAALGFGESMLEHFGADPVFLERLLVLARSQNDAARAQGFGRQLLALSPDDVALLEQQIEIELANQALPEALGLATRLVARAPSARHRVRLAQIADWNSAQQAALEQWAVLARDDPSGAPMARALELAQARSDKRLWLDLLGTATRVRVLAPAEQAVLLGFAERQADAGPVADFLEAYLGRHPGAPGLWLALSDAHATAGDLQAARTTLHHIPAALVGPVELARREALLLDRAGSSDAALLRLHAVRDRATASDTAYWTLLGDLAWKRELRDEAVVAYRTAWQGGSEQVPVAERLVEAANDRGDHAEAIAVAREAHRRFDEPRWLLIGMDSASRGRRWDDLRALLTLARNTPEAFERSDMYWMLSAHLAEHEGSKDAARADFHRALDLKPDSTSIRVALLWFEVDGGHRPALSKLLQEWEGDAASDPAYWGPFAVGLVRLHRDAESLPWFERQMRSRPGDSAWQLEYAEALARAGRPEDAKRARHEVYARLRTARESGTSLPRPLMLSYADLVRQFEGDAKAQVLLLDMIERGDDSAEVRERLVDVLFSQRNVDAARKWLQRSGGGQGTLPARQYLALAESDNDHAAIARILASDETSLSAPDRIAALRKLGRNKEALQLARQAAQDPEASPNPWLREMTEQLQWQQGRRAGVLFDDRRLGKLGLRKVEASAGIPVGDARLTVRVGRTTLSGRRADVQSARIENDVSAVAESPFASGDARVTLGVNDRRDHVLAYGRVEWTRQLDRKYSVQVDGYTNMLSEESALMREIGKKDKLAAAVTASLGETGYGRFEIGGQRYRSRGNERLGSGQRVQAELGTTLSGEHFRWQNRLSASWEHNRLATALPSELGNAGTPFRATVSDVVPARFGWAGLGSTMFFGDQGPVPGHWHGFIDGLLGEQWPARKLGYGLRAALAFPLGRAGELHIEAFHSNVQNGVAADAIRGARFSWQHRF